MTIIIPMAGLSSRFAKAGFTLPKYMLYVNNRSLFDLAVSSFEKYLSSCRFVFVAREVFDTPRFIEEECQKIGIADYKVVVTDPTKGQAETVYKGIQGAEIACNESILIFNIDTFRFNFTLPEDITSWDGYLECFVGCGSNWSYAKTVDGLPSSPVIETAEKKEISNFCSTGIYYFRKAGDFIDSYNNYHISPTNDIKELYVAPLYNQLIAKGAKIHVNIISRDQVIFCGIPEEYYEYLKNIIQL